MPAKQKPKGRKAHKATNAVLPGEAGLRSSKRSVEVKVKRTQKSIHISYSDPRHVLPRLMELVSEFTPQHLTPEPTLAGKDVLGTDAAKKDRLWLREFTVLDVHSW